MLEEKRSPATGKCGTWADRDVTSIGAGRQTQSRRNPPGVMDAAHMQSLESGGVHKCITQVNVGEETTRDEPDARQIAVRARVRHKSTSMSRAPETARLSGGMQTFPHCGSSAPARSESETT